MLTDVQTPFLGTPLIPLTLRKGDQTAPWRPSSWSTPRGVAGDGHERIKKSIIYGNPSFNNNGREKAHGFVLTCQALTGATQISEQDLELQRSVTSSNALRVRRERPSLCVQRGFVFSVVLCCVVSYRIVSYRIVSYSFVAAEVEVMSNGSRPGSFADGLEPDLRKRPTQHAPANLRFCRKRPGRRYVCGANWLLESTRHDCRRGHRSPTHEKRHWGRTARTSILYVVYVMSCVCYVHGQVWLYSMLTYSH